MDNNSDFTLLQNKLKVISSFLEEKEQDRSEQWSLWPDPQSRQ